MIARRTRRRLHEMKAFCNQLHFSLVRKGAAAREHCLLRLGLARKGAAGHGHCLLPLGLAFFLFAKYLNAFF